MYTSISEDINVHIGQPHSLTILHGPANVKLLGDGEVWNKEKDEYYVDVP